MVAANYAECEKRVLAHEGGYSNIAADPGGPTNWGITIFDARKYWKSDATAEDVRRMPKSVAEDIYRTKYWAATRCDDLPSGVDDTVFDYSVNSGFGRSGKVLRRVLGLSADDWHVTNEVLTELRKRDPKAVIVAVNDERLRFLQSLRTWPTFGKGWGRRVNEVRAFSLQLAAGSVSPSIPKPVGGGKGVHPEPQTGSIIAGGSTAAAGAGGLAYWLGEHQTISGLILGIGFVILAIVIMRLKSDHVLRQETPMPGTPVVPVLPSVMSGVVDKPIENPLPS